MPDVAAGLEGAVLPEIGGDFDAVQDPFGRDDLIGAHGQKLLFGGKDTVFRQDRKQRMPGEESPAEIHEVADRTVAGVGPPRGEFEAVAGAFSFRGIFAVPLADVVVAGGVAVILRERAVGDDEDLDVFKESAARPEGFASIAVDLVERLAEIDAAPLEFDVDERKAVDEDGDVIAVFAYAVFGGILVDDLQFVVMDVVFVNEVDIFDGAVGAGEELNVIVLNDGGFFADAAVGIGDGLLEEAFPFGVGEREAVQFFEFSAQIGDEFGLGGDGEILIRLGLQECDKCLFEFRLGLIGDRARRIGRQILRDDGTLWILGNDIIPAHGYASFASGLKVSSRSR